jgi:coenzyme PQQ precursor peptide PqqA
MRACPAQFCLPGAAKCRIIYFSYLGCCAGQSASGKVSDNASVKKEETAVKETWSRPQVTEQAVGLEVTSYVAAEIDA